MPSAAELPRRTIGMDEALYVLDGAIEVDADGQCHVLTPGCFLYAQQGTLLQWRATADARALIWPFPGGFDEAIAGGHGDDRLVTGWLESNGTRFVEPLLAPDANGECRMIAADALRTPDAHFATPTSRRSQTFRSRLTMWKTYRAMRACARTIWTSARKGRTGRFCACMGNRPGAFCTAR